ncbi:MAG: T9SS type A sorting domain-containing protein [Candidatus Fermentibacteraceae bacterium]|nr:T9SS type A sorting domain-containing protein [Candidatus Fermentibacteraceae bacterium]
MTLFMIFSVMLTGRISDWEHFTHLGGVSEILVEDAHFVGATSGGVIFGTLGADTVFWDSTWTCPGELSFSDVRCLARDESGNLWMGTNGGGIDVQLSSGGFQHYGQLEGLPISLKISCIFPDTTVWVGTSEGLCSKNLGYFDVWTIFSTGGGLPSDIINCIAPVDSGLFVGTSNGIVMLRKDLFPGSPSSWLSFPSASEIGALELLVAGDTIWAASTTGLYFLAAGQEWQIDNTYPGNYPISLAYNGSELAVGGQNDVCIFDGTVWRRGTYGLLGQLIEDICWLSTDSLMIAQVTEFSQNRASGNGVAIGILDSWYNTRPEGSPSNDLFAVAVDSREDIWVTSNHRGAGVLSQYGWTEFGSQLPSRHQLYVCLADYNGGVFLAPWHHGVTWLDWNGTPQRDDDVLINWNTENSGLLNNQIKGAAISLSGEVWFAQEPFWATPSEPSGVVRLSWTPGQETTASWKTFEPSDGLPSGYARDVAPIFSSPIAWMGTELGLVKGNILTGQTLYSAGPSQGLPSADVQSIALSRNEDLYVGTTGGLAVMKAGDDSFTDIEDISGNINMLCFDNLSCLWVGSSEGLYRIYPDGSIEEYNTLNSPLQSIGIRNAVCDTDNGLLYLVTDHGLWKLHLEQGMTGNIETATVYPNPFVPTAGEVLGIAGLPNRTLDFHLFDLRGELVYESLSQNRDMFSWDGYDNNSEPVASGTYIVRISQDGESRFFKLAIVR